MVVYMRTRRGGRPLSGGSDAAVTGDGQTEQLPPCPALPVKNAPTKPLSQESNAPVRRQLWGGEAVRGSDFSGEGLRTVVNQDMPTVWS